MNMKRILIILILLVFTTGMLMGSVSAAHTFKDDGFKYKMSNKDLKKLKKYAKKHVRGSKHAKVSKIKYVDSIEKLKVGKTYNMMYGKTKVLKLVKTYKGTPYGGGGYKYKVKIYGKMNCVVEYYKGHYNYYATAY